MEPRPLPTEIQTRKMQPPRGAETVNFRLALENENMFDKATGVEHHPQPFENPLPLVSIEAHERENPYAR